MASLQLRGCTGWAGLGWRDLVSQHSFLLIAFPLVSHTLYVYVWMHFLYVYKYICIYTYTVYNLNDNTSVL